jgi:H+/Cl- antiporter ClcA
VKRDAIAATVSVAWAMVVAVGAYAGMRVVQVLASPPLDPTATSWSIHSGFFWRILTVEYAGGIAAFVAFLVVRRRFEAAASALAPAIAIAGGLLAVQSVFFP